MDKQKPSPEAQENVEKAKKTAKSPVIKEIGGFSDSGLLEPTRYGDWDVKGRCSDF